MGDIFLYDLVDSWPRVSPNLCIDTASIRLNHLARVVDQEPRLLHGVSSKHIQITLIDAVIAQASLDPRLTDVGME